MIETARDGAIATITLHRPEARNALPVSAWNALAEAARALAASDARVVILRSNVPGIFSSGADIAEFASFQSDPAAATRFRHAMRDAIEAVADLPMPVLAAIDGGCFGAAVALILACDLRIAGEGAKFATTPAKLGLGYPREDVARLAAQVGQGQAARMLFSGHPIDAAEAHRIGLVEIAGEHAIPLARTLADAIAANAPDAVRLLKRTLAEPANAEIDDAFDACFAGPEFAAGLAAFQSRRRG